MSHRYNNRTYTVCHQELRNQEQKKMMEEEGDYVQNNN